MKILLVDDEPFFIEELKLTIEHFFAKFEVFPYEINYVFSAEDALDIIPKKKPDCIFTDINMPSMNGVQLSKKFNPIGHLLKLSLLAAFLLLIQQKKQYKLVLLIS
ncbi:response regulator [Metabacillus endolithicus]|uniref:response regulator n=1 Tax=Metabacillus endolithicus TaxID=1535204 RepID=UPI001FF8FF5C|nr:response regulator [Metabacillus endolithicus]UPG62619.1 response regulator [Metabacillus endolithicus]